MTMPCDIFFSVFEKTFKGGNFRHENDRQWKYEVRSRHMAGFFDKSGVKEGSSKFKQITEGVKNA